MDIQTAFDLFPETLLFQKTGTLPEKSLLREYLGDDASLPRLQETCIEVLSTLAIRFMAQHHVVIDPQPQPFEDGSWPIHSQDAAGKWYRPAGLQGSGPYPLFDPPADGLEAVYCREHAQWEWV